MKQYEMRFTGSGGQGVILASVIFAEAGVIAGKQTVQSQAYGPEARGGTSKAETILSDNKIWFSKVVRPDFLLSMNQSSLDQFGPQLSKDAVLLMDDSLSIPKGIKTNHIIALPIIRTAQEVVGREVAANIVAVGAINAALGLFSDEVITEAVQRHIPKGTEALNTRALAAGKALAAKKERTRFVQEAV
jgi:Pyruvate:ferredoxin oxidoreductase and related 2-oxoacid:ferredoxin oxidoreductases, gamma subunit